MNARYHIFIPIPLVKPPTSIYCPFTRFHGDMSVNCNEKPYFLIPNEKGTCKMFFDAVLSNSENASDYLLENTKPDYKAIQDLFQEDSFSFLIGSYNQEKEKGLISISMVVGQKDILHIKLIQQADCISNWKIYEIVHEGCVDCLPKQS